MTSRFFLHWITSIGNPSHPSVRITCDSLQKFTEEYFEVDSVEFLETFDFYTQKEAPVLKAAVFHE